VLSLLKGLPRDVLRPQLRLELVQGYVLSLDLQNGN
jgi:hypothetical protein